MYILASYVCDTYSFLQIIYFIKIILQIVTIIVPIILIVVLTINFVKAMSLGEDAIKKEASRAVKICISAVFIFFIPLVIGLVMNLLGETNFKQAACWQEATKERVEYLKKAERIAKIKSSSDRIIENMNLYIESLEEDFSSEEQEELNVIIDKLNTSISELDIDKSAEYKAQLQKKSDEIKKKATILRWEKIKEKAPKVASVTGVSSDGLALVMAYEGNEGYCNNESGYLAKNIGDGTITAGYGVTNYNQDLAISLGYGQYFPMKSGDCIPVDVLDNILAKDYSLKQKSVEEELLKYNLTWKQNQIDAVVSLAYNCGDSYIPKLVKAYADGGNQGIWDNGFMKCTKASNGNPIFNTGLMNRRKSEYNLFTTGNYNKGF